jgi:putative phage-type endonuclease
MITEEQRKERINYLGSTDCAGVLACSRWRTPIQVWAEKTGAIAPEDISKKMPVRFGTKAEDIVAELFEEDTGKKLRRVNETIYHPKYPFLAANLDRRIVGENAICEIKTVSAYRRKEFQDDNIPADMVVQVYHQLAITGLKSAWLAILIGNDELITKEIVRDEAILAEVVKKEVDFWERFVVPKVMPSIVSQYDKDVLFDLFPEGKAEPTIELGDEADRIIEGLEGLAADKKNLEGLIAQQENELKALLKDHECGQTRSYRITWKNRPMKRIDVKALRKEYPNMADKFEVEIPSRRIDWQKMEVK